MKLKVAITTVAGSELDVWVEGNRRDVKTTVKKAVLASGLSMRDVREAVIV